MANALRIRFRVDFGTGCSLGIGKIELLEGIAVTGSSSEAARQMRMGYRGLEPAVQPLAKACLQDLGKRAKSARTKKVIAVSSIKG